jgi:CRP-like cAMP-binding protein
MENTIALQLIRATIESIFPMSLHSMEKVFALVELKEIPKNETFIKKGSHNYLEYFVLQGIARSYVHSPEGEEITIQFYEEQSILSPYVTRTSDGRSIMNFQALTPLQIAELPAEGFEQLMITDIDIRQFGNEVLRRELMTKVSKELGLASMTARERLVAFREHHPLLENLIPHPHIASYLGITNISLSRLRKELMKS